jgi:hypothetical protein
MTGDRWFGVKWEQDVYLFYPKINLNIFWLIARDFFGLLNQVKRQRPVLLGGYHQSG